MLLNDKENEALGLFLAITLDQLRSRKYTHPTSGHSLPYLKSYCWCVRHQAKQGSAVVIALSATYWLKAAASSIHSIYF